MAQPTRTHEVWSVGRGGGGWGGGSSPFAFWMPSSKPTILVLRLETDTLSISEPVVSPTSRLLSRSPALLCTCSL